MSVILLCHYYSAFSQRINQFLSTINSRTYLQLWRQSTWSRLQVETQVESSPQFIIQSTRIDSHSSQLGRLWGNPRQSIGSGWLKSFCKSSSLQTIHWKILMSIPPYIPFIATCTKIIIVFNVLFAHSWWHKRQFHRDHQSQSSYLMRDKSYACLIQLWFLR